MRADFLNSSRHATLHRVALPQPVDQHQPNQRSEQLEQDAVQRFRMEILDVQILLQLTKQNLNHCSQRVDADHIDGIVR